MAENNTASNTELPFGEFEKISELLNSSFEMQIAFISLIIGLVVLCVIYKKFSNWIGSKSFSYTRPHLSRFIQTVLFPVIAIILVSSISVYVQISVLSTFEVASGDVNADKENDNSTREIFTKILAMINIIVMGFTIARLIPIILKKRKNSELEKGDFDSWMDMRGFEDDFEENDGKRFFHKLFEWIPPKKTPKDMTDREFQEMLKSDAGRDTLEQYRTSKGQPIGTFKPFVGNPFEEWKKSERRKYEEYLTACMSGDNESGQKLRLGVKPQEIYPIDTWREEKRLNEYEKGIAGYRPPGFAEKQQQGTPKSLEHVIPIIFMASVFIGIISWWGIDLFVLGTAVAGFGVGVGFALKETMENLFAYLMIRKDKIFIEGDRVEVNGYNGYIHKITARVTYVRHALNESLGIFPTRMFISTKVINYTKEIKFVPAMVAVGASYLNDARQITAILTKVGKRAMTEIKDNRGNHIVVQKKCPYVDENKPSCGCDKKIFVDLEQPIVRFEEFSSSSLDFRLWVYVREYQQRFKVETAMRIMIQEEFARYDIRIPWPIRTIYSGDQKKETKEIGEVDNIRKEALKAYGTGDVPIDK